MASAWTTEQPTMPFPSIPACYVVFLNGQVGYIGQTVNLSSRMRNYQFRSGYGDNETISTFGFHSNCYVKYRITRRFGDWAMVELRLIRRLHPELNCLGGRKLRRKKAV